MSEETTTAETTTTEPKQQTLPGVDESARRDAAEAKGKIAELEATIGKLNKASKDASKANATAAELKAALDAKEAEEENLRTALKQYEAGLEARATRLLGKLDDDARQYVEKYKGKLNKADWVEMIEETIEARGAKAAPVASASDNEPAPPAPTPGGGRVMSKKHELNPKSREILENMGYDPDAMDHGSRLSTHDAHFGNGRFEVSLKDMLTRLKKGSSVQWTSENANKRGR